MELSRHLDFLQQLTARAVSGCGLSSWYYAGPLKPVREKLSRDEPVHIHFVCQGNIMRSPMAEAFYTELTKRMETLGYLENKIK